MLFFSKKEQQKTHIICFLLNNVVLFKKEKQKTHIVHLRLNNVVLFKKRTTKNSYHPFAA